MTDQLITFQLDDQVLGVDIMAIREIRAWSPATPLPNVPHYVRGVVNLRGVVLPVLDLRSRLGWGTTDTTARERDARARSESSSAASARTTDGWLSNGNSDAIWLRNLSRRSTLRPASAMRAYAPALRTRYRDTSRPVKPVAP